MMTLDEFFEQIEKDGIFEDLIVRLSYKYDWEPENARIISNEILTPDEDGYMVWLNDWDEGYTNQKDCPVYVIGYIKVDDIDIW